MLGRSFWMTTEPCSEAMVIGKGGPAAGPGPT